MTRQQIVAGRKYLKELLPTAIQEAEHDGPNVGLLTTLADGLLSHLTLDMFDALVIHEGERGGWLVDLLLRNVPPGFPKIMGTPVASPLASRQEAQDLAPAILAIFVKLVKMAKKAAAKPVFLFHNHTITLDPEGVKLVVDHLDPLHDDALGVSSMAVNALDRLAELDAALFPNGFTPERMAKLPRETHYKFLMVIYVASACGIVRYPSPTPGTISEHRTIH